MASNLCSEEQFGNATQWTASVCLRACCSAQRNSDRLLGREFAASARLPVHHCCGRATNRQGCADSPHKYAQPRRNVWPPKGAHSIAGSSMAQYTVGASTRNVSSGGTTQANRRMCEKQGSSWRGTRFDGPTGPTPSHWPVLGWPLHWPVGWPSHWPVPGWVSVRKVCRTCGSEGRECPGLRGFRAPSERAPNTCETPQMCPVSLRRQLSTQHLSRRFLHPHVESGLTLSEAAKRLECQR